MVLYGCGLAAFGLYFLNDWNDWKLGRPLLRFCFPLACILLAGATAAGALRQPAALPTLSAARIRDLYRSTACAFQKCLYNCMHL